ncbi:MAG TPA: VWA domain-containing protein, partial [Chitinophagales bacterium]|nr:VWA domain-containing protein [Chitinophagales bacterium]
NAAYAFTNASGKNVYLLKVEAPHTVTYRKPMNAMAPGASDTFRLVFAPEKDGSFNESVKLYFSDSPEPRVVRFKGNLKILDRVADIDCPTFDGKAAGTNVVMCNVKFTVIDADTKEKIPGASIDVAQGPVHRFALKTQANGSIPVSLTPGQYGFEVSAAGYNAASRSEPVNRASRDIVFELTRPRVAPKPEPTESAVASVDSTGPLTPTSGNTEELSVDEYAYNNIVFLIDVSSSMNTSDRMPLLKKSMSELAKRLRPGDRVAVVTYADKAKIIRESKPVTDKDELQRLIESLTPNGGTSADKGLAMAHEVLLENYLDQGNNQLVLATDGSFTLKESDLKLFSNGTIDGKPLNICVTGFGQNKDAIKSLRKTSKRFNGKFIHIDKSEHATNALLDEVKQNSRK